MDAIRILARKASSAGLDLFSPTLEALQIDFLLTNASDELMFFVLLGKTMTKVHATLNSLGSQVTF